MRKKRNMLFRRGQERPKWKHLIQNIMLFVHPMTCNHPAKHTPCLNCSGKITSPGAGCREGGWNHFLATLDSVIIICFWSTWNWIPPPHSRLDSNSSVSNLQLDPVFIRCWVVHGIFSKWWCYKSMQPNFMCVCYVSQTTEGSLRRSRTTMISSRRFREPWTWPRPSTRPFPSRHQSKDCRGKLSIVQTYTGHKIRWNYWIWADLSIYSYLRIQRNRNLLALRCLG